MTLRTRRPDDPAVRSTPLRTQAPTRPTTARNTPATTSGETANAPRWRQTPAYAERSDPTNNRMNTPRTPDLSREGTSFRGIGVNDPSTTDATGSTPRNLSDPARINGTGPATRRSDDQLTIDGMSVDDVRQGNAADCYCIASIAAVANQNPQLLANAVTDNEDGTYNVRLYDRNGRPQNITVDGDLYRNSDGSPTYARGTNPREIWPAIVEKAYAQMNGGYNAIGNGGNAADAMRALTGRGATSRNNASTSADALYRSMDTATSNGRPVVADTYGQAQAGKYTTNGLSAWHSYTVTGVETDSSGQRWVNLRNPWGHTEYSNSNYTTDRDRNADGHGDGNDGHFRMKLEDFQRLFRTTHVGR